MKTTALRYNIIIKKEKDQFVGYVPTLGISDFGKTIDLAKKHIKEATECHIEGLLKTNSEVPAPDTTDYFVSQTEVKIPARLKFAY